MMVKLENIQHVYFIGIGGIGMSAIARYFHARGIKVSGYDKVSTPLTQVLEALGIDIHYTDDIALAPKDVQAVVYTPAIPISHSELCFYQSNGYAVVKRSDVLQIISEGSFNICVAGTHGKTTISSMIAHILRDSAYGCNAFLGGIAANYQTNFWSDPRNVCVIEADEYDRSFLKLFPSIAVISSMDPDHLDIYGTPESMEASFIEFTTQIVPGGTLFSKKGLKREADLVANNHYTYQLNNNKADCYTQNLVIKNGAYFFDVVTPSTTVYGIELPMGGLHNVENCLVAIAVALELKIPIEKIKAAVANFMGVKRRFQYIVRNESFIYIDDYAHHPEEIKALLTGVKHLFPDKNIVVAFQPHLFSRTKDFAPEFASALDIANEILLLPIYPARELPMEGVTSALIQDASKTTTLAMRSKADILQWIKENKARISNNTVFVTAGAGDIDQLIVPIQQLLNDTHES
jgi:UDP-N-acetylmuramate--alanine ligase